MYNVSHFINGKHFAADTNRTGLIFHPASGKQQGTVSFATINTAQAAILAAKTAFNPWSETSLAERTALFFRFRELVSTHLKTLAETICREHGKTLPDAIGELKRGLEVVELACNAPAYLKGEYSKKVTANIDTYSMRQPLGVCVGVTPFNFPAMIGLWMFPLAIVSGNTFIWKPSEKDPSVSLLLAELMKEAGVPDGVLNILQGDKTCVVELITHPDVKAVSCVGSTQVSKSVYTTAISHGKRAQCGGSAKNIAIIMPDADLDHTANAILGAAYGSAGERCMAISAVFALGDGIADKFIYTLKPLLAHIQLGDGLTDGVEVGPLITRAHHDKVLSYLDLGVKEGATLVVDGRLHPMNNQPGFFLGPCLFDQVQPSMRIYQEEIFGPVLSILRPKDIATAIQWVNSHQYGNGTAIFTHDGFAARTFAEQVEVGMVGVNVPIPVPVGYHTFGGWKDSFFGDIGMYGEEGFRFYTRVKTVTERWLKGGRSVDFTIK